MFIKLPKHTVTFEFAGFPSCCGMYIISGFSVDNVETPFDAAESEALTRGIKMYVTSYIGVRAMAITVEEHRSGPWKPIYRQMYKAIEDAGELVYPFYNAGSFNDCLVVVITPDGYAKSYEDRNRADEDDDDE
jgi:hypothetical protein